MRFHAIILAALSAGALSVSLTAKYPTNSSSLPNVTCKGKDNGKNVKIDYMVCPKENPDCNCWLYVPPDGSYIWVHYSDWIGDIYAINVFSDTNCQNPLTTVLPSTSIVDSTHCDSCSDSDFDCVFMGEGVQWGSVMAAVDTYKGPGVNRTNGVSHA